MLAELVLLSTVLLQAGENPAVPALAQSQQIRHGQTAEARRQNSQPNVLSQWQRAEGGGQKSSAANPQPVTRNPQTAGPQPVTRNPQTVSELRLSFRVIAHPSVPVDAISREALSAVFMKRRRRWEDGTEIVAIDQQPASRTRERFSQAIHQKSVAYVIRYWHRLIFSGRGIPPPEGGSSNTVLEMVRSTRGAIGYVELATPLDDSVKLIRVMP